MLLALAAGILLLAGGMLFAWKIGGFRFGAFFGLDSDFPPRTGIALFLLLHLPWFAGAWLIGLTLRRFFRNRER